MNQKLKQFFNNLRDDIRQEKLEVGHEFDKQKAVVNAKESIICKLEVFIESELEESNEK